MRVLLVHNYYGSAAPSGENIIVDAEKDSLERNGIEVELFSRNSDDIRRQGWIGLLKGGISTIGNPIAAISLVKAIRKYHPDVIHFHNTFPLISPLAVHAAHQSGAKVVMTVHNYRVVCAAGVPLREGHTCQDCFVNGINVTPSLRHRCYRGRFLATLPVALNIWLYQKRWPKWVDRFIVLSQFQREKLIACGFPAEKIAVKGNFADMRDAVKDVGKKQQILYVGRLSDEKGVLTLIKAWKRCCLNLKLIVVGDGEKRSLYERMSNGSGIIFLGKKSHADVCDLMRESLVTICPSECWETFGLSAIESLAEGTPIVVSDCGALPELVERGDCGEVFKAGDADALAAAINKIIARKDYAQMCRRAKDKVRSKYSEAANFSRLMSIYKEVLGCEGC